MQMNFLSIDVGYGGAEKMFSNMASAFERTYAKSMGAIHVVHLKKQSIAEILRVFFSLRGKCVLLNCSVLGVGLWQVLLLRMCRSTIVLYPHLVIDHRILGSKLPWLRNFQMKPMLRLSTSVISISRGNDARLMSILPNVRLVAARNFVSADAVKCEHPALDFSRIAVIGRIQEKHKGQLAILRSLGHLLDAGVLRIDFFGSGPDEKLLSDFIVERHWEHSCTMHGWKSEEEIYSHPFSAVINFSRWEGLPLSLIEAIRHGRIVIANDIPGNQELTHPDWLFSGSSDCARVVEKFLNSPRESLERSIEQSKKLIECNYNEMAAMRSLEAFLKNEA